MALPNTQLRDDDDDADSDEKVIHVSDEPVECEIGDEEASDHQQNEDSATVNAGADLPDEPPWQDCFQVLYVVPFLTMN